MVAGELFHTAGRVSRENVRAEDLGCDRQFHPGGRRLVSARKRSRIVHEGVDAVVALSEASSEADHGIAVGKVDKIDVYRCPSGRLYRRARPSRRSGSRPTRCTVAPRRAIAVAAAARSRGTAGQHHDLSVHRGGSRQTSRRRRRAMPTRLKLGTTVISARASTARAIGLRCCDRDARTAAQAANAVRSPAAARSPMRRSATPTSGASRMATPLALSVAS